MTRLLAGLAVAIPGIWLLRISGRLMDHRTDLAGRDTSEIFWDSSVKRFDPAHYDAEGKILLRWFWVSHAALMLGAGVGLWLLARKGLL